MAKEKAKEREKRSKREERKVKRKQSRVSLETHSKPARVREAASSALDYERDRRREKNRVDAALRRLGKKERAFARAVLRGESWREMGLAKSTFSDRMKKVEKLLSRP